MKEFDLYDYGYIPGQAATGAFLNAFSAAKVAGEGVIRVPDGVLTVDATILRRLKNVVIQGTGRDYTTIKALNASGRIFEFHDCDGLTIKDVSFDAAATLHYGGVAFYSCSNVVIEDTRYFTSDILARSAIPSNGWTDIYSYVFGHSFPLNENVVIRRNVIDDLQLEVDSIDGAVIEDNIINRPVATAGIGIFSLQEKVLTTRQIAARDVVIQRNKILDISTARNGIALNLDPAKHLDNSPLANIDFRDILIAENEITLVSPNVRCGYIIKMGAVDNTFATSGIVYDGITVERNTFRIASGLDVNGNDLIQFMTSRYYVNLPSGTNPDFYFTRTSIRDNTFYYGGSKNLVRIYQPDSNKKLAP